MKRQRPQRQYKPERSNFAEKKVIEENPYHAKEILKSDIAMLEEQNSWLKLKCKNLNELQDKVQMVLKQNAQLLSENQKMSRYLHQQKTENQMLRNKCDSLNAQKYEIAQQFEKDKLKLLKELQNLEQELTEVERLKEAQIDEVKKQFQIEIQNFKKHANNSENSYELQIRKLNDQLTKKDFQLRQYSSKLKKVTTEADYDILKLKEDRDRLKNELIINQKDYCCQLQNLKANLQSNYFDEVQALKRLHLTHLQELKLQNANLVQEVEAKNRQRQQIGNNFNKQRLYYEDSIALLKKDVEIYRQKLVQTDKNGREQVGQLKQKLGQMHENQLHEVQSSHQAQIRILEEQIAKLEASNRTKSVQIEKLIKQKSATCHYYDSQMSRGKDEYGQLLQKFKDTEAKNSESLRQLTLNLIDKEKQIQYLQNILRSHKQNAQSQAHSLQLIIQNLKHEVSNERMISKQKEQAFKEQLSSIRHQLNEATLLAQQKKIDYQRLISELKSELSGTSYQLNNKSQVLTSKTKILQKQNEGLRSNIALKDKELKSMVERLRASTQRESKLSAQINQLQSKMIKKEEKSNEAINQQKIRMENSFSFTLQNLKNDHEAAMKMEANKYRNLQDTLKKKQTELNQLLLRYKKMTDQLQVLTEQQANKKDITLKFPGATSDLIATKNIFDIYLKAKVLDICGDALKQNKAN